MKPNKLRLLVTLMVCIVFNTFLGKVVASDTNIVLDKAPIDRTDFASLQRGARTFINNCQGCHSLKYARYNSLAKGIGIADEEGNVLSNVVKSNLVFVGDGVTDPILSAMPAKDAETWFGTPPPDLSLVARLRGVDWLYTYMRSFYKDSSKPWGVNNLIFSDVAMPHVLVNLQGIQEPVYKVSEVTINGKITTKKEISGLKLVKQGTLSPIEYDRLTTDLVNFLSYVGEPVKLERERLGAFVLAFLGILLIFTYLLKREYWKDIK